MRVAVVAVVIAWSAQLANATPPDVPAVPAVADSSVEEPVVSSYRAQTLAADGIAVGLLVVGGVVESEAIGLVGVATYVVGAPIVHLTKPHRGKRAFASLTLRAGLPLLGVLIGDSIPQDCGPHPCMAAPSKGVMVGLVAGTVAASALDTIFLAKGDASKVTRAAWSPVAGPTRDGFALGVAGQF